MDLATVNALPPESAHAEFLRCCHATRWADAMTAARPFLDEAALFAAADAAERALTPPDWLEAFRGHPMIGDVDSLRQKFPTTADWSANEQSGVAAANEAVIQGLADGNRAYRDRFGYIFIVCATGKGAGEMLDALRSRLGNDPDAELAVAADEQKKITRIRLRKLLA